MRTVQNIASLTGVLAGTVSTIPLTALQRSIAGEPANLMGIGIRLTKSGASTVRPSASSIVIRDQSEPLFDSTAAELLGQMRERGEAVQAQLGTASATDSLWAVWRPGYGQSVEDAGHAAGLFSGGGSVVIQTPADGVITYTIDVVAFLDTSGGLRIAPRAITRTLPATTRELSGDFLLARLRDLNHTDANVYSVRTAQRELVTGVSGFALRAAAEVSLGPAGDPVILTAVAQSTLVSPNIVRSMLSDYSYGAGEKLPPVSRLPKSDGAVTLTAGFAGGLTVTYLYPRSRQEAEDLARAACAQHGIAYRPPMPPGNKPELYPFLPLRLVG